MSSSAGCLDRSFVGSLAFLGYLTYKDDRMNPKCLIVQGLALISGIALLIIGCVGAAGCFPSASLPWVTLGLSMGGFVFTLSYGDWSKRKFQLISQALMTATFIILGALGGSGVLTTAEVSYGIIGTTLALLPMGAINFDIERRARL